jgi:rfaE bifunctional protein kinase chain/domain/rfaE bifunctional protein nucleotidyltransferase chain/domain
MAMTRPRTPRVAVVGDYILDAYVRGRVNRVCPDAPAAVLDAERELCAPGGAGNVAVGCSARGLEVIACGLTGRDSAANILETLLAEAGIRLDGLVAVGGRTTLVKRRYCAGDQILLRVDEGTTEPADARRAAKLSSALDGLDAILVSDYGYGTVTSGVLETLRSRPSGIPLLVDAKDLRPYSALVPDVVKPNHEQALRLLGEEGAGNRVEHMMECGQRLLNVAGAKAVVVTLDREGAVVIGADGSAKHIPAPPTEVRTTSGAGDTFLVALASALLAGSRLVEAARFATHAASGACRAEGTASVTVALEPPVADRGKRVSPDSVAKWAERMRMEGRRVAVTNGCFDIFHAGHAEFLQAAAEAGDVLLVAVNTDESVRRLKGDERPVNALEDRLRVLEAIGVVSAVTWFDDSTAAGVVDLAKPDAYVKGSDYRGLSFPEAELVRKYGGRVVFVDLLEGRSTSGIVERLRGSAEVAV